MRRCPRCGTQNEPLSADCARCGEPLVGVGRTVAGFPSPLEAHLHQGVDITPSIPTARAPEPQPPAAARIERTMLGFAPLGPEGWAPAAGHYRVPVPATIAPRHDPLSAGPPPGPRPPLPTGPGGTHHLLASERSAALGAARSRASPRNRGKQRATTIAPQAGALRSVDPPPHARRTSRDITSKPGVPALAAAAMFGAAASFVAAAVVWLFFRGHGVLEAHASVAADGHDQLELYCAACPDGATLRLDAAHASFSAHRAVLPLLRPLEVGENPMTITLASAGKQSFVEVTVPIAFRVRGDTAGLDAPSPYFRVAISAVPGSSASVYGKPVVLDAQGEGSYVLDVSAEVTGLDAEMKTLERRVPYVVTPPDGAAQPGNVSLQARVTPLMVDAPGSAVVLDTPNFLLAGRTSKTGALTVGDRSITVDATGRFAQMMNVSAPGDVTIVIRATSQGTAPRLFPLRVKRVESLAREGEQFRHRATSNYSAIAERPESKRGWAVALDGVVVDARTENYNTLAVMDVRVGCAAAPCLARLVYGAPFMLARGDKLSAFGHLQGAVAEPRTATRIPEVHADFLIRGD